MKRATNLSVDAALLDEARKLGVNLSRVMEDALRAELAAARGARWLQENAEAIEAYRQRVAKRGVFSDKLRRF